MLKKKKSKQIYKDNWVTFYQDEIEFPDGSAGTYSYANRQNGVGVVVVSSSNKILLHKEHRYVIDGFSWEIQGGGIDEGESAEEAAVREVKEEAGISIDVSDVNKIGCFYPLHSFNTELVTLFMVVVDDEVIGEVATEDGEHLEEHRFFTFDEVEAMINGGEINDAMTANAVQIVLRRVEG